MRVVIVEPGYIAPGMRNAVRHGEDGSPYEELRRQWSGADDTLVGPAGRPGPELVGRAIADAIDDPSTPLRVPVGADAELVLATLLAADVPLPTQKRADEAPIGYQSLTLSPPCVLDLARIEARQGKDLQLEPCPVAQLCACQGKPGLPSNALQQWTVCR